VGQGALTQQQHLQPTRGIVELGRGVLQADQDLRRLVAQQRQPAAQVAIPGQQVLVAVRRGHPVMDGGQLLGRVQFAQVGGGVGDVIDPLDLADIEGVVLVQVGGLGHVVQGAFLVADVRQRVAVNLVQLGEHRLGDAASAFQVDGQVGGQPRGLGPTPHLPQVTHALDPGHQPDVGPGVVQVPDPIAVGEGAEAMGLVAIGQTLQLDQRLQSRVVLGLGGRADLRGPFVEPAFDLVALIGVQHPPQAVEPRLAAIVQRTATGPLDVLVVTRRMAQLVGADLLVQLLQPLGQGHAGLSPRGAGREGSDEHEGYEKTPQIRILETGVQPSRQLM
jgi:hypothetical protein